MSEVKITKKDYFEALKTLVGTIDAVGDIDAADVVTFLEGQIKQIDDKAEKARVRAAEKKAEGDALRDAIQAVLTDTPQTRADIFEFVKGDEYPDLTVNKVGARLTQLVKAGVATKEPVKGEKNMVMAYKLA